MSGTTNEGRVMQHFEQLRGLFTTVAGAFVEDGATAVDEATNRFAKMVPDMAYVDKPDHAMAAPLFLSNAILAMYLSLRDRGVDVHEFGRAVLENARKAGSEFPDPNPGPGAVAADAAASQKNARPGEFVFEVLDRGPDFDVGLNIKSCGICFQFAKYDAMDLVPYMCAIDDVISDAKGQGLRRTGTIALGAHQCDFRFKLGGQPLHLAPQYPDRIRDTRED